MESPMSGGCWRNWTVPRRRGMRAGMAASSAKPWESPPTRSGQCCAASESACNGGDAGASPPIRSSPRKPPTWWAAPVRQCRGAKRGREAAYSGLGAGTGWLRLPDGKALTGFNHEYKRHGTFTLFAALEVATGQVKVGHFQRRRRRDFLRRDG